jgi:hypothetical protein
MSILLILLLAPVVLAAGCGLLRLMMEPVFWGAALSFGIALLFMMAHG